MLFIIVCQINEVMLFLIVCQINNWIDDKKRNGFTAGPGSKAIKGNGFTAGPGSKAIKGGITAAVVAVVLAAAAVAKPPLVAQNCYSASAASS